MSPSPVPSPWGRRGAVAVTGVGFSPVERPARTPAGVLTRLAISAAVADAGLSGSEIDGLATYPEAPYVGAEHRSGVDVVPVQHVARRMFGGSIAWSAQVSSGMITSAVTEASAALIAGLCSHVVIWRTMHLPAGGYGRIDRHPRAAGDSQFSAPWRLTTPAVWHALAYRRYLNAYRGDRRLLGALALSSRAYAASNPFALFNDRPLLADEYVSCRMVADPIGLLDCDVPVQASIAIVLTTADRAAHAPSAAYIAGLAVNTPSGPLGLHYTVSDHHEHASRLAGRLWAHAGLGPGDMSAAQLYDGFAPSVLYWLEGAGFCRAGEALDFIQDGRIGPEGQLPVNTFGGSLSAGRTHGMGHLAEAARLVRRGTGTGMGEHSATAVCAFVGSPMLDGGAVVMTSTP